MKKVLFALFILGILFLGACGKTQTKPIPVSNPTPTVSAQGDASVDSVGNAIADVDAVDQDLNEDDMKEIDSGLNDVESI